MQLHHNSDTRNMTMNLETNSRVARLRHEWEELCSSIKPNGTPDLGHGHGDPNSWILELSNPRMRGRAMQNLCTHQRQIPDLGVLLWNSFGSVSGLMQEILDVFSEWKVERKDPARVIHALKLFQAIAEHPKSKIPFVCSKLHDFIAPFMKQGSATPQYEEYRLGALRVINALLAREVSSYIEEKEYGCIAMQLLADNYLQVIVSLTVLHGGVLSQENVVRILASLFYHDNIFTVITNHASLREHLSKALELLFDTFMKKSPELCQVVQDLYRRVQNVDRQRTMYQVTPAIDSELTAIRKCHRI